MAKPHRAFVEEFGRLGKTTRLVAVYEHCMGSKIHREDINAPTDADDIGMMEAISAAWSRMIARAVAAKADRRREA